MRKGDDSQSQQQQVSQLSQSQSQQQAYPMMEGEGGFDPYLALSPKMLEWMMRTQGGTRQEFEKWAKQNGFRTDIFSEYKKAAQAYYTHLTHSQWKEPKAKKPSDLKVSVKRVDGRTRAGKLQKAALEAAMAGGGGAMKIQEGPSGQGGKKRKRSPFIPRPGSRSEARQLQQVLKLSAQESEGAGKGVVQKKSPPRVIVKAVRPLGSLDPFVDAAYMRRYLIDQGVDCSSCDAEKGFDYEALKQLFQQHGGTLLGRGGGRGSGRGGFRGGRYGGRGGGRIGSPAAAAAAATAAAGGGGGGGGGAKKAAAAATAAAAAGGGGGGGAKKAVATAAAAGGGGRGGGGAKKAAAAAEDLDQVFDVLQKEARGKQDVETMVQQSGTANLLLKMGKPMEKAGKKPGFPSIFYRNLLNNFPLSKKDIQKKFIELSQGPMNNTRIKEFYNKLLQQLGPVVKDCWNDAKSLTNVGKILLDLAPAAVQGGGAASTQSKQQQQSKQQPPKKKGKKQG